MSNLDTSRISITAHYTGYTWYANDLSSETFVTKPGALMYYGLLPANKIGAALFNVDLTSYLLQRHLTIDHLVKSAIEYEGVEQIIEIACGLSPRGFRYIKQFQHITYVETDLPVMVKHKRSLLEKTDTDFDRHWVLPCNVLIDEGKDSLASVIDQLDCNKKTLVITEGLLNYFSRADVEGIWKRIANGLERFPEGIYVAETVLQPKGDTLSRVMSMGRKVVEIVARGKIYYHFSDDTDITHALQKAGFKHQIIYNTASLEKEIKLPNTSRHSVHRVVKATV